MPVGLIALALGGFGIGLTEFVIAGLLPAVAADFEVCSSGSSSVTVGPCVCEQAGYVIKPLVIPRAAHIRVCRDRR